MDWYEGRHLPSALWSGYSFQVACCRYIIQRPVCCNSGSRTDHRRILRPCHFLSQGRPALPAGEYRKSRRIAMRAFRSRQAESKRGFRNRRPVVCLQHTVVSEILIPDEGRVRLSSQHFAGEFESSIRLTLIAVHVDKVAWRERKGRSACGGSLRKAAANTVAIKLYAF